MFGSRCRASVSRTSFVCCSSQGEGERPIALQSLLHVLCSSCHAKSIRQWDAARARFWDSVVRGCSALQFALRRRLLREVGVILVESTASENWDLQKFYDSLDLRQLLRLGAECGFPESCCGGPPGPSWTEGLAFGGSVCQHPDGGQQHFGGASSPTLTRGICCMAFWRRFTELFPWSESTNTLTIWLSARWSPNGGDQGHGESG